MVTSIRSNLAATSRPTNRPLTLKQKKPTSRQNWGNGELTLAPRLIVKDHFRYYPTLPWSPPLTCYNYHLLYFRQYPPPPATTPHYHDHLHFHQPITTTISYTSDNIPHHPLLPHTTMITSTSTNLLQLPSPILPTISPTTRYYPTLPWSPPPTCYNYHLLYFRQYPPIPHTSMITSTSTNLLQLPSPILPTISPTTRYYPTLPWSPPLPPTYYNYHLLYFRQYPPPPATTPHYHDHLHFHQPITTTISYTSDNIPHHPLLPHTSMITSTNLLQLPSPILPPISANTPHFHDHLHFHQPVTTTISYTSDNIPHHPLLPHTTMITSTSTNLLQLPSPILPTISPTTRYYPTLPWSPPLPPTYYNYHLLYFHQYPPIPATTPHFHDHLHQPVTTTISYTSANIPHHPLLPHTSMITSTSTNLLQLPSPILLPISPTTRYYPHTSMITSTSTNLLQLPSPILPPISANTRYYPTLPWSPPPTCYNYHLLYFRQYPPPPATTPHFHDHLHQPITTTISYTSTNIRQYPLLPHTSMITSTNLLQLPSPILPPISPTTRYYPTLPWSPPPTCYNYHLLYFRQYPPLPHITMLTSTSTNLLQLPSPILLPISPTTRHYPTLPWSPPLPPTCYNYHLLYFRQYPPPPATTPHFHDHLHQPVTTTISYTSANTRHYPTLPWSPPPPPTCYNYHLLYFRQYPPPPATTPTLPWSPPLPPTCYNYHLLYFRQYPPPPATTPHFHDHLHFHQPVTTTISYTSAYIRYYPTLPWSPPLPPTCYNYHLLYFRLYPLLPHTTMITSTNLLQLPSPILPPISPTTRYYPTLPWSPPPPPTCYNYHLLYFRQYPPPPATTLHYHDHLHQPVTTTISYTSTNIRYYPLLPHTTMITSTNLLQLPSPILPPISANIPHHPLLPHTSMITSTSTNLLQLPSPIPPPISPATTITPSI